MSLRYNWMAQSWPTYARQLPNNKYFLFMYHIMYHGVSRKILYVHYILIYIFSHEKLITFPRVFIILHALELIFTR